MDLVDCIYVINLDARTNRWERMEALLKEQGLQANRVSAINGWQLTETEKEEMAGPYPVRLLGGPLGCLLSHLSIYQDALNRGFQRIWVLEDDADFVGDVHLIPQFLEKLFTIDPLWDVLYTDMDCKDSEDGCYTFDDGEVGRPDQTLFPEKYYQTRDSVGDKIVRTRGRYGMTSVLLSQNGLQKLVDYLSHVYIWTAIDCDIHFIPTLRQYSIEEEIVTNLRDDSSSDTKSWSDLNPDLLKKETKRTSITQPFRNPS